MRKFYHWIDWVDSREEVYHKINNLAGQYEGQGYVISGIDETIVVGDRPGSFSGRVVFTVTSRGK